MELFFRSLPNSKNFPKVGKHSLANHFRFMFLDRELSMFSLLRAPVLRQQRDCRDLLYEPAGSRYFD